MATKFCALYQRKKGRDLFDLVITSKLFPNIDHKNIVRVAGQYFNYDNIKLTRALFEENMAAKLSDNAFTQDTTPLLPDDKNIFDASKDFSQFSKNYIALLPGDPWKGKR